MPFTDFILRKNTFGAISAYFLEDADHSRIPKHDRLDLFLVTFSQKLVKLNFFFFQENNCLQFQVISLELNKS